MSNDCEVIQHSWIMGESSAAAGSDAPQSAGFTPLEALVADTRRCCLRPFRFFVSWQGVLTLAYTCAWSARISARMVLTRSDDPCPFRCCLSLRQHSQAQQC